jgi:hypothetical protein
MPLLAAGVTLAGGVVAFLAFLPRPATPSLGYAGGGRNRTACADSESLLTPPEFAPARTHGGGPVEEFAQVVAV